MKKFLKSYLVFTSLIYRIVMFILMPVVMIAIILWQGGVFGVSIPSYSYGPEITICISVMMILPLVEIVSDNWMFGGIQSKNADKLDYLKTSGIGMQVLRRALSIDLCRKFLSAVGIIGVSYGIFYWRQMPDFEVVEWEVLFFALLVSYLFSVLGTVLTRYGSMIWINVMSAYLLEMIILIILVFTFSMWSIYVFDFCVLSAILDVVVSILAVRIAMKKVEGSYYDK